MNIYKTILTMALTIPVTFNALAGQAEIDRIEQAAGVLDVVELKAITAEVNGYDKALAYYRLGLSANLTGQSEQAIEAIDQAIEILEQLNESTLDDVEIKALLAQVYGYKIALEPLKGMYYGPKSSEILAQATALDPTNPRVQLITGISKISTPAIFGGDSQAAYQAFDKAISAYSTDSYSNYHWGYAETYTWRGLAHKNKGDIEKANQDWQLALNINPEYSWAKILLEQNQNKLKQ
ncbi:tetratricopeptide repeat protein [Litorilituus lipolyticus]|uniref:Tetratricopeptide repeat protein n=1 Tax=Litorilituus lipolyticus TaxID=2491017 RepID=A0A502L018_9GAMM|nr:tetratricopeptide repeat protein [Litorilituus lipolyticus]TPH17320.1 tetratricopeptide repeat protein [Litorilituus lipolyticus]